MRFSTTIPISFFAVFVSITLAWTGPLLIDHTCTNLGDIPLEWIDSVKTNVDMHYAHTSHGGQLVAGLDTIMSTDPFYAYHSGSSYLPTTPGVFCLFDGQEGDTYISPDEYWETAYGMGLTRDVLDHNPSIRYSMWSWCGQPGDYLATQMNAYCESLAVLDAEYPGVTVIYMTGHAQYSSGTGYTRYHNNNIIRDYCAANDKALFDFGDIDAWWFNPTTPAWEFHSYDWSSEDIPLEHPHYGFDEVAHTSWENCEHKGAAFWWMMAVIEGWDGPIYVEENPELPDGFDIAAYPNPFNSVITISVESPVGAGLRPARVEVFDLSGRHVAQLPSPSVPLPAGEGGNSFSFWEKVSEGRMRAEFTWQPEKSLSSGVYLVRARFDTDWPTARLIDRGGAEVTKRIVYLK